MISTNDKNNTTTVEDSIDTTLNDVDDKASSSSQTQQQPQQHETTEQQFTSSEEPLFHTLGSDDNMPLEIESFCVGCEKNGVTRLLFTKIPHFREVIISSFNCPHCGLRNQEVQFGGSYGAYGVTITLKVEKKEDLNRQIVKSDYATLRIPEIDFEIPENTQKGTLTTVEGVISTAIDNLLENQPARRVIQPAVAAKIDEFIERARHLISGEGFPFTVIIDDYSGNSNIEKLVTPHDPQILIKHYARNKEQTEKMGLSLGAQHYIEGEQEQKKTAETSTNEKQLLASFSSIITNEKDAELLQERLSTPDEIFTFTEKCYGCGTEGVLRMMPLVVPYFKEIILMAFKCDHCGYKTTEVRAGGAIAPQATKITLKVSNPEDLSRDVLKSETASLDIPELELHVAQGSLGGKFTTVEGLLMNIKEKLTEANQFRVGDSSAEKETFTRFLTTIDDMQNGKFFPWTLIIDDPVSNSYVQNLFAPDDDPYLTIEHYDRTFEQNEELGLNDIKTD
ncbi:hypothetical protein FDP41_002316 [Naegleria fowleri]|uniref:Zinc finger ZPR1-type domain-containing protein n=1 Tax=Naegleria fowleri TaxID=5763 RepID=A0A6A5BTG8_NAEFO|nr:uncharacterized protein FDP41_002316 [Naegleria fowleri]KAF0978496.1 hypothetical protein FDP41_002316 [Naegleria fowleri]CAG4719501.1 unnamed protein product [Naegleria fowleri]